MSHIPAAAMPHAKPHAPADEVSQPVTTPRPLPWAALAAGGALAIGGAVAAALLLRGRDAKPEKRGGGQTKRRAVPRRRKAAKA